MLKYIAGPLIGAVIGYFTNFIAVKMLFFPRKEIKVFGHVLPFTPGAIPKGKPRLAKAIGNAVGNNLITQEDIEKKLLSEDIAEEITNAAAKQLTAPIKDTLMNLTGISEEVYGSGKEKLSIYLSGSISDSISQIDLTEILVTKAPEMIKQKVSNPLIGMFMTDDLLVSILQPIGGEIQEYIRAHGAEYIEPYVEQKISQTEQETLGDFFGELDIDEAQVRCGITNLYRQAVNYGIGNMAGRLDLAQIAEDKINAMSVQELEQLVMSVMKKELNMIVNLGALIGFLLGLFNLLF